MTENVNNLFEKIGPVFNDESLSLEEKITRAADHYIDLLLVNPDFPKFIVNEVLSGSNKIPEITAKRELILQSHFAKQIFALYAEGKIKFHPVQLLMNLMGMLVFPFLGKKLFSHIGVSAGEFEAMMQARKQLIPVWVAGMIST
jgi:hypothetical protein